MREGTSGRWGRRLGEREMAGGEKKAPAKGAHRAEARREWGKEMGRGRENGPKLRLATRERV